jgi:tetratricopeptide (TPR) repeat protein
MVERYGAALQRGLYFQRLVLLSYRRDRYVVPDETVEHARSAWTAIRESGTPSQAAFARFVLGFTHLWHGWAGDLAEAEAHIQAALKQAEQIGDVVVQTRCLNFLTQIYRRQGRIDRVRRYVARTQAMAEKANMVEYIAESEAQTAWVAWREGDLDGVQTHGLRALTSHQETSIVWPAKWMAAWPLLGVALRHNEIDKAIPYASMMLAPDQQRLPDELTARLQQALAAWAEDQPDMARSHLHQALHLAQDLGYL